MSAHCPVCRRPFPLRADGPLTAHHLRHTPCKGAGQPPAGAPDWREELAAAMVPVAFDLVAAVRLGDAWTLAKALLPMGGDELRALVVVLAAAVDPREEPEALWAWTREIPATRRAAAVICEAAP